MVATPELPQAAENTAAAAFPDGVKVLCNPPDAVVDICFIHGLSGNREGTWTAKGQDAPWPALLLPPILSARISTYGYNAYLVRKGAGVAAAAPSANRLLDHAANFLLDLTNDRAACRATGRPLVIVAHSMGGLVCKQALLLSRGHPDAHFHDMADSLRGIVFMGTPHRGSWMANWGATPASVLSVFRPTNVSLLDVLETESQFLEAAQDQFLSLLRRQLESGAGVEITCFFEELPSFGSMAVVPKESAILEGYRHFSIHATHAGMVKFASADDTGFKRVSGELLRWQASITAPKPARAPARTTPPGRTSPRTLKVKNMRAGDNSTQVVEADRMTAEGLATGNNSFQILSPDAQKIMMALQASSASRGVDKASLEETGTKETEEVVLSSASPSSSR